MVLRHSDNYVEGYELLVLRKSEKADMLMDFASLSLKKGESWHSSSKDERAFLLAEGSAEILVGEKVDWIGLGIEGFAKNDSVTIDLLPGGETKIRASRTSLLDENPTVLHLPKETKVIIKALSERALFYVSSTDNDMDFSPRLYLPYECRVNTATRAQCKEPQHELSARSSISNRTMV